MNLQEPFDFNDYIDYHESMMIFNAYDKHITDMAWASQNFSSEERLEILRALIMGEKNFDELCQVLIQSGSELRENLGHLTYYGSVGFEIKRGRPYYFLINHYLLTFMLQNLDPSITNEHLPQIKKFQCTKQTNPWIRDSN